MKITYDHYYGQMENHSLQLYTANLECDEHEERHALASGWLLYNGTWYQSRSTRICLADWKQLQRYDYCRASFTTNPDIKKYREIWSAYLESKSYPPIYDPFELSSRDVWMEYYINDELLGFTKLLRYQFGLESQFNAYVPDTKIKIGLDMLNYEVNYAISRGLEYLYIGSGYENGSKYKAKLSGFEWWTGSEWSRDTEKYIDLCDRDSKITTIKELSNITPQ